MKDPDGGGSPARFYDDLAATYHQIFPDWEASSRRQGDALHALVTGVLGPGRRGVLDCAVGIGTQLLGLARHGHQMTGSDVSPGAVARARVECSRRGVRAALAVADMRALPFADDSFEVVVCADNSLSHLLTAEEVTRALGELCRVATPGGLVVVTTRDYDRLRAEHPQVTPPQLSRGPDGPATVTFQLWEWWPDGERYDLRHFQVRGEGEHWELAHRQTTYWALTRAQLTDFAHAAGLAAVEWLDPDQTGFFQPVMLAWVPGGAG